VKKFTLPDPPNPNDIAYKSNPLAYSRAANDWMRRVKGTLEASVNQLGLPASPSFVATSYTTNTVISGTTTGTDLTNAVCSLITALTNKGILIPN